MTSKKLMQSILWRCENLKHDDTIKAMTKKVVTNKGAVMTEVSAKEFGKLQSDVEYLKDGMDKHTKILENMDSKLDGVVTYEQLNKVLEPVEHRLDDHSTRILALEQRNTLSDASVWRKIGLAFEGNFVKFVGVSLFVFALFVFYLFIRQDLIARDMPVKVDEPVEVIEGKP